MTKKRARAIPLLVVVGFVCGAVAGCSERPSSGAPPRMAVTTEPNTITVVKVEESDAKENPMCRALCSRLVACWYAIPDVEQTLSDREIAAKCRSEHRDCRKPTDGRDCCANVTDCHDFAKCYGAASDEPSACDDRQAR